jgi:nucleotide-binding universal stress UspA family protein
MRRSIVSALFSRILVGVDDSDVSREAVAFAARLAREHDGQLVLAHSVNWAPVVTQMVSSSPILDTRPIVDDLKQQGQTLLDAAMDVALHAGVKAEPHALEGEPAHRLLEYAAESHCTLIVMGTHGRQGLQRVFVGSTTEAVLRASAIPVLTLRAGVTHPEAAGRCFERIVVAIDDSEPSDAALEVACAFPAEDRRYVALCSIAGTAVVVGDKSYHEAVMHDLRAQAERLVDAAEGKARARGVTAEARVAEGNTDEALIAAAKEEKADLIVLGSHGRRGLRRFFIGSVAEGVVRRAPVPVLVIRTAANAPAMASAV